MKLSRKAGVGILAAAVVLVVAVAAGAFVLNRHSPTNRAKATVEGYLSDWSNGRYPQMAAVAEQPVDSFTSFYKASAQGLEETRGSYQLVSLQTGANPSATFNARVSLANYPDWTYTGTLPLVKRGNTYRVVWTPAALHPALKADQHLGLVRTPQNYGHVLDRNGKQISTGDTQLAQTVIGRAPSDAAGAGKGPTGLHVRLADTLDGRLPAAVDVLTSSGKLVTRLQSLPGKPGQNVRTTLDLGLQKTAENVASGSGKPTSIVLMDARSGAIVAAAGNSSAGPSNALTGRFPPGSTFKIVTATAALQNGFTLDTPVSCPPSVTAGGVTFKNAENEALGQISFLTAFEKSCNTAFVNIAEKLPKGALAKTAAFYGCSALPGRAETPDALPIPTFTCNYPPVADAEYAASAFGQAQVETSPLGMASIVAAASTGTWQPPRILPPDGPLQPSAAPRSLPANVVSQLRTAMQAVVSNGTATSISGSGVAGKTGTAEFGTKNPPQTHAWFTGYLGKYAAAVLVQDGGFGGDAAAPLAARVLQAAQASG
ncbi:MAG TPA: penicillin-binding transpeptidase domain-containing protein [Frankiaceae bacterium]|nr:penicillin-binding transpeptidase domain-containing protein [Frankiaceae bacterium]